MFCPKCGKEINSGTKFCSGCGNPIEIPAAAPDTESAPYVRSTIDTPVSDTPVYIPEPAKANNSKKFISIGIVIAMIAVLVLGFLKYQDLGKGLDGKWKAVGTNYGALEESSYIEISGNKVTESGSESAEYILEGNTIDVGGGYTYLVSLEGDKLTLSMVISGMSLELYYERVGGIGEYVDDLLIYIIAFAVLLVALIVVNLTKKGAAKAMPAGTYSGTTGSLTVSSTDADKATATEPIEVPSVETAPVEPVNPVAPAEPEVTFKSDMDTYNTVAEFEAASGTPSPAMESAPVSYPTAPAGEEKKDSGNEWFTTAGDL